MDNDLQLRKCQGCSWGNPELETKYSWYYDKEDIYSIQVDLRCFIHTNMRDLLTARSPRYTALRRKNENVHIVISMGCEEYQLINSILENKELVKVDLVSLPNMDIKLTIHGIPLKQMMALLSYGQKPTTRDICSKAVSLKNFKVKMLARELPVTNVEKVEEESKEPCTYEHKHRHPN
ncbi:2362_t:CDS:2 [Gigaspora margarita]|uniref:2362_t:CDS:1 n=1 Tax=Gigaspora margarita TaxID=4874 RepID=A0ABN7UDP7_GIGMA|nr:2362_t:CDS:2 [Gigaspora margarita]